MAGVMQQSIMTTPQSAGCWSAPACLSRRAFLIRSALLAASLAASEPHMVSAQLKKGDGENKARVAISLDLEMARNFPHWTDTHWDYEKGNLNEETKRYALEAARRVKARGAR